MEINTDIPLSQTESTYFKKFKNLSVNETPKPQGEGEIRISPFDDYFIFTLYNEIDGVDSPIDLSNVGTIYMVFIGKNDEVRIPQYTNVQDVNLSAGQVLFRIGKNDSQKILALDNNNFYISTMMTSQDGTSDESVVYTGKFLSFNESASVSVSQQLNDTQIKYAKELANLQLSIEKLNSEISQKNNLISEQSAVIDALKDNNQSMANEISILSEKISSTEATRLLSISKDVQKAEEDSKLARQQIQSINEVELVSQTKAKKKAFFEQAAKHLRSNIPGINRITSDSIEINDIA